MIAKTSNVGRTHRTGAGFTLIELLVVVAIIMVLISIALPNLLQATLRANVAAALGDMKAMGTALGIYNVDYKQFPQAVGPPGIRLRPLISPVKYIETLPRDRFGSDERFDTYDYGAMPLNMATHWLMASHGPDRSGDSRDIEFYPGCCPGLFIGLYLEPEAVNPEPFRYLIYSPTNGTISKGDLYIASDCSPS